MPSKKVGSSLFKQLLNTCKSQNLPLPIYVGDKVQVMKGRKDVGKQGKVTKVDEKSGTVIVDGVNLAIKILPYVKDSKIRKVTIPQPVSILDIKLVDPITNAPTKVKLFRDTESGQVTRISAESGTEIPKLLLDPLKDQKENSSKDTDIDTVEEVTWQASLDADPFPAKLWNQIHKLRRFNRETTAL